MTQDNNAIWGNTCLPIVLESLGKSDPEIKGVRLHFAFGDVATATFMDRSGNETMELLPIFSLDYCAALGTPSNLNALTLDIFEENFVTIECRYFPVGATAEDIVAILREWAEPMVGQ